MGVVDIEHIIRKDVSFTADIIFLVIVRSSIITHIGIVIIAPLPLEHNSSILIDAILRTNNRNKQYINKVEIIINILCKSARW